MEKNYSRIISFLLAIVMVVGLMPAQVFATETESAYPTVQLDQEFTVEIATSGAYGYFTFIPETSGIYVFESYADEDTYGYICDANGYSIQSDDDSGEGNNFSVECALTAGETYILKARYYSSSRTGSFPAKVYAMETTDIAVGEESAQSERSSQVYCFVPETDGKYAVYASGSDVAVYVWCGSYWSSGYNYYSCWNTTDQYVDATAGEPVMFKVVTYGNATTVGVAQALPVESITCDDPEIRGYYNYWSYETYTAYANIAPAHADISSGLSWSFADSSLAYVTSMYSDRCSFWCQGVGETELIVSIGGVEMLRIPAIFENYPEITLDEPITTTFLNRVAYSFTPEESGAYSFYISETDNYVSLASCNGKDGYGYMNSDGTGSDMCVYLEAGETFYLRLSGSSSYETTCTVTVTKASAVTSIEANVSQITGTYISGGSQSSTYVEVTFAPEHADISNVQWTIADTSVAEISDQSMYYCYVYPVGVGETELIITAGDAELRIPITFEGPKQILLDTPETVYSENYNDTSVFSFVPEESGSYTFYVSNCDNSANFYLTDAQNSWLGNAYYDQWNQGVICVSLVAGEVYTLHARSNSYSSSTFDVTVIEAPAVESITCDTTEINTVYMEESDASYYVDVTVNPVYADVNSLQWQILDTSVAELDGPYGEYCYVNIVGVGETELVITAPNGVEVRIPITVVAPIPISEGDEVTVTGENMDDETWFVFTPEETAYYSIYVGDCTSSAYISLRNRYNSWIDSMYAYSDSCNAYICAELTAGETYYLCCRPDWDEPSEFTVNLIRSPEATSIVFDTTEIRGVYTPVSGVDYEVNISVEPQYAVGSITWTIGDTSVAEINYYGNNYCYIYATGVGETTLTASLENGVSVSIPVVFTEPQAMEPDVVYSGCSQNYSEYIYYSFTPEETASYIFTITDCDNSVYFQLTDNLGYYISSGDAYSNGYRNDIVADLYAGETYYLKVRSYSGNPANFSVMCYKEPQITEITSTVTSIEGFYAPGTHTEVFVPISVLPENATLNSLDWHIGNIANPAAGGVAEISAWSDEGVYITFISCGTAELQVSTTKGDLVTLNIPITVSEPYTLWLNSQSDGSSDNWNDSMMYSFTPETTDDYSFYCTEFSGAVVMYLLDSDGNCLDEGYAFDEGETDDVTATLEAGQTYTLVVHSDSEQAVNFFVTVIESPEVESITCNQSQISALYIPGNTSNYYVSFTVAPEHASASSLTYEILDPSVAEISGVYGSGCTIVIKGVGQTELVATHESGLECRVPIVVTAPEALVPGNTYTASAQVNAVWYSFTPEETGEYIIYSNAVYNDPVVTLYYVNESGNLREMDYCDDYDYRNFYLRNELQAGVTYYYKITYYSTYVEEPESEIYFGQPGMITGITVNMEEIAGYVQSNIWNELDIETTPKYSDLSSITVESTNEEIVQVKYENGKYYYALVGEGTSFINITWGEEQYEIPVTAEIIPALELDVPADGFSEMYDDINLFSFTPAEDGHYTFYMTNVSREVYFCLRDSEGDYVGEAYAYSDGGNDLCAELEAGETYFLQVRSNSDNSSAYTVTVIEAPAVESITPWQEQVNLVYISGADMMTYVSVGVAPNHAAASSLRYEILDTSVAAIEYIYGNECGIIAVGVGQTELVISTEDGVECRVSIVVTEPAELVSGNTYTADCSNGYVYYKFTPEVSGNYIIYSMAENSDPAVRLYHAKYGYLYTIENSDNYDDSNFYLNNYLEAGVTYYYRLRDYGNTSFDFYFGQPGEITSITVNTEDISGYVMPDAYYHPLDIETTPKYSDLSQVTVESTNEEVVRITYMNERYYYSLVSVGTAQIIVTWGDQQYTINVEATTVPELVLDEVTSVTTNMEQNAYFTFTPTESGVYSLYAYHAGSFRAYLYICNEYGGELAYGYYRSASNNQDAQCYLEAGVTYYVHTAANTEADSTYTICMTKAKEPTSIECDVTAVEGYVGAWDTVQLSILPAHANLQEVTCVSSDTSVVQAYLGSGYLEYYLVAAGTATITITAGELQHVIQVTAKNPTVLELGVEEEATSQNYNDVVRFQFTPEESGLYTFYFGTCDAGVAGELYDGYDYIGWMNCYYEGENRDICIELEAGVTYYLNTWSDWRGEANYTVCVIRTPDVTDLTFSKDEINGYLGNSGNIRVETEPAHGNLTELTVTVADEKIASAHCYDGRIFYELLAVGETQIIVTLGDLQWTIPVTVTLPPEMELNVTEHLSGERETFLFIPDETGSYTFYFSDVVGNVAVEVFDEDFNYYGAAIWFDAYGVHYDLTCELEAGEMYLVQVYPQESGFDDADLTVIETPKLTGLVADCDEVTLTYISGMYNGQYVTVRSVPAHADLSEVEWTVADPSVAMLDGYNGNFCYIIPTGLGETVLIATLGNYEVRIPVKVTAPEEVPLNTTLTITDVTALYTLTPSVTGEYTFTTSGSADPYIRIYEVSEDGELFYVTEVDDTGDSLNYTLTCTLEAGKQYIIGLGNYEQGVSYTLLVTGPGADVLYGDVNKDGNVDNMDAALVLQYAAKWDVELKDAVAADVNCDGNIDNMDAALILQYAAKWDVDLGPSTN